MTNYQNKDKYYQGEITHVGNSLTDNTIQGIHFLLCGARTLPIGSSCLGSVEQEVQKWLEQYSTVKYSLKYV